MKKRVKNMVRFGKENKQGACPMCLKIINDRLYFFKWKPGKRKPGKKVTKDDFWQIPLGLFKNEKVKGLQAVGAILKDLEEGKEPCSPKTIVKNLVLKGRVTERAQQVLDTHIIPFFGEFKPHEIDEKVLSSYIEFRFGLDSDGSLRAYQSTLSKELQVLQRLLQSVNGKDYRLEYPKYSKLEKEILPPLTIEQIEHVSNFIIDKRYIPVYWFMVYTGVDIMDAVTLKSSEIKNGWIDRKRSKTNRKIKLPICDPLKEILNSVPRPLDHNELIFKGINSKATSTYLRRIFKKAGLEGYGPKYLRRFVGSFLTNEGYSESWVAQVLSHVENSEQTKKYCQVYEKTLIEAFGKIKKSG